MSYSSEVLADSPVVYYRLGESSGTSAADSSGNGRTGTYVNAPTLGATGALSGDANTAAGFTRASSQQVTFGTAGLPSGSSPYTFEIWCKPTLIDEVQGLISIGTFGSNSQSNALRLGGSASAPTVVHYWWGNDATAPVPAGLLSVGAWSHIVATWNGTVRRVYVNGVLIWTDRPPAPPNVTLTTPRIGQAASGEYFNGSLDEAAIYNTALSPARVVAHYRAGVPSAPATPYYESVLADVPEVYFRLNEGTGTTAKDASGFRRDGALQGTITWASGLLSGSSDQCIDFDGTSTRVDIGAWTYNSASITVDALIRMDAVGKAQFIAGRSNETGTNRAWKFMVSATNKLELYLWSTADAWTTLTGATTLAVGTTYHVAGTYNSATGVATLYVNGVQDATSTPGITLKQPSAGGLVGARYDGSLNQFFDGRIDEVAQYATALSASRIAAHSDAATGVAANTGFVSATASAPNVSVAGAVITTGQVSAVAGSPTVAVAGVLPTTGAVAAVASSPTVTVAGDVAGVTAGVVTAVASSPAVTVAGDVTPPVDGSVTITAPKPSVSVTDNTLGGTLLASATLEVGPVTLLNLVTLPGTELGVGATVETGDAQVIVPLPGTVLAAGASLDGRIVEQINTDPRRGRTQWRYVVTDLANKPLGELVDIQHGPVADGINAPTTMQFTMAADDPARALIEGGKTLTRKCQVWDGDQLLLWGPILPDPSDGAMAGYTVHDPSWYWRGGRRVIGRFPRLNLLKNGDFRQGLTYWTRGYDADSIPKAAPTVRVVTEDFLNDSDGVDPIRAAEIVGVESVTEAELSSNAVFYPNLATFRPGGKAAIEAVANAMPTTTGLKVSVVGHTANDGTGNGLGLSARRAEAAKTVILSKRPHAIVSTKGVGYYDPKPGFPIDSQEQRRVVISYDQTISGKSKQFMRQTLEVTQPKSAKYGLELTAAAMLKVADDWSVEDANMMSVRVVARRKSLPKKIWDESNASISDTDPIDRWIGQATSITIPADGRPYLVDVYLYAPAALARYTAVGLFPEEELFFWGTDQALIFKGIAEHIQDTSLGHGDLGIETRTPLTGIKRDRTYPFREHMPADTALEEFGGLNRGMDYDTIMRPDGRVILSTFYPQQGKRRGYVLVQGGNVAAASPERSRDLAGQVIMQAQDLGQYRAEAYARDTRVHGGLLLERVVTAEQETPLNELREAARQELLWGRLSTTGYWLDIDPDSIDDVLANTGKGDVVRLILDSPLAVDSTARIINRERHPDSLRLLVALDQEV